MIDMKGPHWRPFEGLLGVAGALHVAAGAVAPPR